MAFHDWWWRWQNSASKSPPAPWSMSQYPIDWGRRDTDSSGQRIEPGADLRGANLNGAHLRGADLKGADLRKAKLVGANLENADLRGAILSEAELQWANLRGADLKGADLRNARLVGAKLVSANLDYVDIRGADLRRAKFFWSPEGTLAWSRYLDPEKKALIGVRWDVGTRWPRKIEPPHDGSRSQSDELDALYEARQLKKDRWWFRLDRLLGLSETDH